MKLAELVNTPVLIAGAGISGLAAAAALVELGARVTVVDANPAALADLPDGAVAGGGGPTGRHPARRHRTGPPPGPTLVAAAATAGVPVVGEPELAWWIGAGSESRPWLVVTGTNGKTTTVGMLEVDPARRRRRRRGVWERRISGTGTRSAPVTGCSLWSCRPSSCTGRPS